MRTLSIVHYPGLAEEIWKVNHNYQAKLQKNTSRISLHKEVTADGKKNIHQRHPESFLCFRFL